MDLDEFVAEQKRRIEEFEKFWRENNKRDPKAFPIKLSKENTGLWYEQFQLFDE